MRAKVNKTVLNEFKPFILLAVLSLGVIFIAGSVVSAYTVINRTKDELLWSETLQIGPNATETVAHNFSYLTKSGRTPDGREYQIDPSLAVEFNISVNLQEEYFVGGTSIFSKTYYGLTWMGFQASVVGVWHISANTTRTVQMNITKTEVWTETNWHWNEMNVAFGIVGLLLVASFFIYPGTAKSKNYCKDIER